MTRHTIQARIIEGFGDLGIVCSQALLLSLGPPFEPKNLLRPEWLHLHALVDQHYRTCAHTATQR